MGAWACVGDRPAEVVVLPGDGGADSSTDGASSSSGKDSEPPPRTCNGGTRPGLGLFDTGNFKLWLSIEHAADPAAFDFSPTGAGSNIPVAGHWTAGDDTIGWFTPETVPSYTLLSSNTADAVPQHFSYGPESVSLLPVVGDWDGNGTSTVGVYDQASNQFFLANANQKQAADFTFMYGSVTNGRPVAGDWDGDGKDGVGIFVPADGRFLLRNSLASGPPDVVIGTNHTGDDLWPLASNWDGCGVTVALYSRTTGALTYLETNATAAIEHTFMTKPGKTPLVGHWKK